VDLPQLVAQVGFPMAVAVFVLVRLEGALHQLRDEVRLNTAELRRLRPHPIQGGSNRDYTPQAP
jgi:hypothetical protein